MPSVLYLGYYSQEYSLIVPRSNGQDAYEIRICRKEKGRPEACRSTSRPCPADVNARAVINFRKNVDAEAVSQTFHAAATSAVAERQLGDSLDRLMRRTFIIILDKDLRNPENDRVFDWSGGLLCGLWSANDRDVHRTVDRLFDKLQLYEERLVGARSSLAADERLCDVYGKQVERPEELAPLPCPSPQRKPTRRKAHVVDTEDGPPRISFLRG